VKRPDSIAIEADSAPFSVRADTAALDAQVAELSALIQVVDHLPEFLRSLLDDFIRHLPDELFLPDPVPHLVQMR
jgi:hypothetical protein